MPRPPLVSVIIPAYNAAPWLAQALESVLAQTWHDLEVVVVDDGSRDDTLGVARRYAGPRVRVVTKANGGASQARNAGLAAATGDYVQFLDADDLLDPHKIERQLARLRDEPPGTIASCGWARFWGHPLEAQFVAEPVWRDHAPVDWLVSSWSGGGMMSIASWLVPRHVAAAAGPWNEALSVNDDGEYFTRVLLASSGVAFCPDAYTYYRSGIGGLSQRAPEAMDAQLRSLELSIGHLLAREDSGRTRAAAAAHLQRFVFDAYPAHPDLVDRAEALVASLGGSSMRPGGGFAFRTVSRVLGWKAAKRVRAFVRPDARAVDGPAEASVA